MPQGMCAAKPTRSVTEERRRSTEIRSAQEIGDRVHNNEHCAQQDHDNNDDVTHPAGFGLTLFHVSFAQILNVIYRSITAAKGHR